MANRTEFFPEGLYDYMLGVSLREPPLFAELREVTSEMTMSEMQISPEQGQFMRLLAQLIGAKKTIEVGVYTGYSALSVASVLPEGGRLVACDVREEWTAVGESFWEKAGVRDKIDLRIAPAAETLDNLLAEGEANSFDFAFIDADKESYPIYYEKTLELMRSGGLIMIDNVFLLGKVADANIDDERTVIMREFNQMLQKDKRVSISMLPISDGITLALKR